MAFVRPGLSLASMKEHLHAAPHQVLPARAHSGVKRALLLNFNKFTCNRRCNVWVTQRQMASDDEGMHACQPEKNDKSIKNMLCTSYIIHIMRELTILVFMFVIFLKVHSIYQCHMT